MASNTPNLNLLKKDPVTDGNDTFNIRTMLNDNWDKIDAAVGEVRDELQDIEIPNASLNKAGIVQLSNETSGSRENVAATEKAVSQAFQAGNERKAEVVAALVALGVPASTSETWAQLIAKMSTVIKASGNATAADLLIGKTASNANGPFAGTMPDRGAATITPSGTAAVSILDGAYKGAKVAQVSVPAAKVLNDTTIAGVKGSMANQGAVTITPGAANKAIPVGYHNGGGVVAGDADLISGNIRSGIDIFGVTGTLVEGISESRMASGSASSGTSGTSTYSLNTSINVNNLTFKPKLVIFSIKTNRSDLRGTAYAGDYGASGAELRSTDSMGNDRGGTIGVSYQAAPNGFSASVSIGHANPHNYYLQTATVSWIAFG